ncbi:hypothetical protein AOQ84DRAFT_280699 [Glonium stellatum]|uniref:Ankyrin repeat protein n=1 Tax=Glonium stellatum TaxID=574774 RepID=A0A8E2FCV1_9PEZI|nr:hypothetical protein AOQ84DRAFT_280699 [Glonium stellatum]
MKRVRERCSLLPKNGDADIARLLLGTGADVCVETKYNNTPLLISSFKGHD